MPPLRLGRRPDRLVALSAGGRGGFKHLSHGVVELADAGKPSGECDIAERQIGGFDQYSGGLCTLRASQRKRAGADLGLQALELAGV